MENWWSDTDGKTKTAGFRDHVPHPTVTEWNSRFLSWNDCHFYITVSRMTDVHCCVISGFHHEVGGTRTLLGCYAATSGNLTKCCPATSVRSYQYSLCNKPDERSSFLMYAVVCNGFELSRIRTNQDTQGNIFLRGIKGRKMRWAGPVTGKGEK